MLLSKYSIVSSFHFRFEVTKFSDVRNVKLISFKRLSGSDPLTRILWSTKQLFAGSFGLVLASEALFAKLRRATVSCVMSVRPSVRPSVWMDGFS